MNEVYKWTSRNRLVLNDNEAKVMLFGSRQRLDTLQNKKIYVIMNVTLLECVSEYKCLDVKIDDTPTTNLALLEKISIYFMLINLTNYTEDLFSPMHYCSLFIVQPSGHLHPNQTTEY